MTDAANSEPQVMEAPASITSLRSERERGFTDNERAEIITRLQVVENIAAGVSAQVAHMAQELFPLSEDDKPVNMLREVHSFCIRLSQVLDAMSGNPMLAAMLPADMLPPEVG